MAEFNRTTTGQYSETDASNTSPAPDGAPTGSYFNQVEGIFRALMGACQRFWDRINAQYTVGGSANAITLTSGNTVYPLSYVTGETYQFKALNTNTAPVTLNINGLGVHNIYAKTQGGISTLNGGEIQAGDMVIVSFDGTYFQMLSFPSAITGTMNNNNAAVGNVGEYESSTVTAGAAVPLSNNAAANVTFINLGAGDWDVWGSVVFAPAASTVIGSMLGGISTTSASLPAPPGNGALIELVGSFGTGQLQSLPVGITRISLAATASIYLVAASGFSNSTNSAYGFIGARRRR